MTPAPRLNRLFLKSKIAARLQRGFSLIEISLVLIIVGLALGAGLTALGPQLKIRNYTAAQESLTSVTDAIYGFAILNGRLPCPAQPVSLGREQFCTTQTGACVPTLTVQAHGRCSNTGQGYLPTATLGLPGIVEPGQPLEGLLIDKWANPIRYAVSQQPYTNPAVGICNSTCNVLTAPSGVKTAKADSLIGVPALNNLLLRVCSATTASQTACAPLQEIAKPAFLVFSTGANGRTTGGPDEAKNVNKTGAIPAPPALGAQLDLVYVSQPRNDPVFDDLFYWQPVGNLIGKL